MTLHYAALDPDGSVLGVSPTIGGAQSIIHKETSARSIVVETIDDDASIRGNAIDPNRMPELARKLSTLELIDPDVVRSMSLEEAAAACRPFFKGILKRGAAVAQYDTALGMLDAWIGQNYKTSKDHPGQPSKVMGLTLVPASHPRLAALGEGPYEHLREGADDGLTMIRRWKRELPDDIREDKKFTLCAGSNAACRNSCLVYAGQNASELYNGYRKVAQTMALLREPAAFMRLLVGALERWFKSKEIRSGEMTPYFRMNVLSDVPWELVAPWVFDLFPDRQFYDYTKIPGRNVPRNYDLTFSVSGTNLEYAQHEINERGRRIAVVFLGHKQKGTSWAPVKLKGPKLLSGVPLPRSFWGLPVVDGDVSDVRPLDPSPSCVGLRWKTPSGKRAGVTVELAGHAFVVPVYIVENAGSIYRKHGGGETASWRGQEPSTSREQWLVSPVTSRSQPIDHEVAQIGLGGSE
jgi:hypothetical protein